MLQETAMVYQIILIDFRHFVAEMLLKKELDF